MTLRLRNLDDIGLGEIALVIRKRDCGVKRLELSGNFGNSGVKIFAEALKTNVSLKTVTFGCYKNLDDAGGRVLLEVVDPFAHESTPVDQWEHVKSTNHTLQSLFILDRPTVTVNKGIVQKLESISTLDPLPTLQAKVWHHIENNIDDLSHIGLDPKHLPNIISFVNQRGALDHVFQLMKSSDTPEVFNNPSPERTRILQDIEEIEMENEKLRELLDSEREETEDIHRESNYLRTLFENKEEAKKCCLLPISKIVKLLEDFILELRAAYAPKHQPTTHSQSYVHSY